MAENYYQHAEHYYRIIMSAQSQQAPSAQPAEGANGSGAQRGRRPGGQDGRDEQAPASSEPIVAAEAKGDADHAATNGDGRAEDAEAKPKAQKKAAATNGGGEPEEEAAANTGDAPPKTPAA